MKKQDTLNDYEDMNDVFDNEFIEQEFEDVLYEWRSSEKEE